MNEISKMATGTKSLVTVNEACDRLSIGKSLLYREIAAGKIISCKVGSRGTRIPVHELERYERERFAVAMKLREGFANEPALDQG